jgi:hypothetical protein
VRDTLTPAALCTDCGAPLEREGALCQACAPEVAAPEAPAGSAGEAEAPAEAPGESPDEIPAEAPGEVPGEAPAEALDEAPGEAPAEAKPNGSAGPLALVVRVVTALIYFGLCILLLYFSVPFFEDGDWWFGAMAVGLAVIAVIGIKQSLFPKEWTPE